MNKLNDFVDSVKRLAEEVTPEMLCHRAELQAEVGMDNYRRRIGGWVQSLKDCQRPKESVLEAATRSAAVMKALGYAQGQDWVLAAYIEIQQASDGEAA